VDTEMALRKVGHDFEGPALAAPYLVEERIRRDPAQPTLQGPRLVGGETPADPEQHLLDEVLRIVVVARQPVRDRAEGAPMITGDLLPRRGSGLQPLRIRRVRHGNDARRRLVPAYGAGVTCWCSRPCWSCRRPSRPRRDPA